MKLPAYQADGSIGVGNVRLQSPDNSIAQAVTRFGSVLTDTAENLSNIRAKEANKLQAENERNENLRLERDLLDYQNKWRDDLELSKETAPQDGIGFTDQYDKVLADDEKALLAKYQGHHDPEYVKLKIANARNPYQDQASNFEFQKNIEFKKATIDDKVANISAAASVEGVSYEQAEAEYKRFIDTAISANPSVRKQGYEYGLRQIQKAFIAGKAARDKKGFVDAYTSTFSAPADSEVLPPHISTSVANAQAQGFDPRLLLGIGWIESRLNPNAGNPTKKDGTVMSSADGMFQVLGGDNPTAAATRAALGISRADVRDVDKVSTALSTFLVRKQEWMRQNRIEPTPGRTYMMWNMGEGAAAAVMRANPNERIENVLSRVWASKGPEFLQKALYNNPSMYKPGQTVGQVIRNYEDKVQDAMAATDKITSGAGLTSEDRAKSFVNQYGGIRGDQFVTAADVADVAEKVIADYGKEQKDNAEITRGQLILRGDIPIDPYNSEHKRATEKALEAEMPRLTDGVTRGDGEVLAEVGAIADQVNHLPEPIRNAMRITLETGDAGSKSRVYGSLLELKRKSMTAFNATNFDSDTQKRIEEFEAYTSELFIQPEKAIAMIDRERTEEGKARKAVVSNEVNKELGKIPDKKIINSLNVDIVGAADIDENKLTPIVRSHFERIYRDAREDGKDKAQAEALANTSIKEAFGISTLSGESVLMIYPPERQFKELSNGHDWIDEQARNQVATYLLTSGRVKAEKIAPTGKVPGYTKPAWQTAAEKAKDYEVRLVSTSETVDDVRRGKPPRYQLWFRNDKGQTEMASGAFVPDFAQAAQVDQARFTSGENEARRRRFDNRGASIIRATRTNY